MKKSKKTKLEKAVEEVGNGTGTGSGSGEDEPIATRTRKRSSPQRWEVYRKLNDLASLILWKIRRKDSVEMREDRSFLSLHAI